MYRQPALLGRPTGTYSLLISMLALLVIAPASAEDKVVLGTDSVQPGGTAEVAVFVVDDAGTILGVDRPFDFKIQGLSVGVRPGDSAAQVTGFTAAGELENLTPLVETTVASGATTSWIAAYDRAQDPIDLLLDGYTLIGYLQVPVSAAAPVGTTIDLLLSPTFTVLSNQSGTVILNGANGGLLLGNGTVVVESTPLFEDDFESGDTSAWSASSP